VPAFEFPLNEKVRSYLRADELLGRVSQLVSQDDALSHHFALQTLLEMQEMLSRTDIKGELIRDMDRQRANLSGLRDNEHIEQSKLEEVLTEVAHCHQRLSTLGGKPGQGLSEVDWVNAVRGRITIPAGTCSFDLPAYHHWQRQPSATRQSDLRNLAEHFSAIQQPLALVLKVLRQSGEFMAVVAKDGVAQYAIPGGRPAQLLRLELAEHLNCVPEISANRLNIAIRWMEISPDYHLSALQTDVAFRMCLCH